MNGHTDETMNGAVPSAERAFIWVPGRREQVAINFAGLALFIASLALLGWIVNDDNDGSGTLTELVATVALTIVLLAIDELIRGAFTRAAGGTPALRAYLSGGWLPAIAFTAYGHRFRRTQYAAIEAAPLLLVTVVGALGLWAFGNLGVLVMPLAINLGLSVGDLWAAAVTLRQPPSTDVQPLRDGLRFILPAEAQSL